MMTAANCRPICWRGSVLILSTLRASEDIEGDKTMEMKNPVHPGLLVKECLDDLGLSVAEAAKGLGISRQQLHNVIAGRSNVTPEMAIRFEKAFGSTAHVASDADEL